MVEACPVLDVESALKRIKMHATGNGSQSVGLNHLATVRRPDGFQAGIMIGHYVLAHSPGHVQGVREQLTIFNFCSPPSDRSCATSAPTSSGFLITSVADMIWLL